MAFRRGSLPGRPVERGDGENDYQFLQDMFNKRNKDDLSRKQEAKICQMLKYKVVPFVRDHPALG